MKPLIIVSLVGRTPKLRGLLLSLLILSLLTTGTQAQAPPWQTAAGTPGTSVVVKAMAPDDDGNLIVVGSFANTATFGATVLTSTDNDGFVAKWSPTTGRFVWVQHISGPGSEFVKAVAVSGSSIYVGGVFTGRSAAVGRTTLANTDFMGNNDLFVARFTDAGTSSSLDWAQRAGDQPSEDLTGLAVNGRSLYITGTFSGKGTAFGSIRLSNPSAAGFSNIFLVRLTDLGNAATFDWAQAAGGPAGGNSAVGVAVQDKNIYLTGSYIGAAVQFGSLPLPTATQTDWYVAKFTDAGSTGSFTWARVAGGTGYDYATALAVNGATIYCAGYFNSPTLTIGNSSLSNAGSSDIFLVKLIDTGSTGDFSWATAAGGADFELINQLVVSGVSIYATGYFNGPASSFGNTSISSAGLNDVFLTKLTDVGTASRFDWTQQAGGPSYDSGVALAIHNNRLQVAGTFYSPVITFSPTLTLTRPGPGTSLFLASLTDGPLTAAASPVGRPALFSLAPNPARATTTLTLPSSSLGARTAKLALLDNLGRILRRATIAVPATGLRHELTLQNLPAGLYTLRVQLGAAAATHRLLVE